VGGGAGVGIRGGRSGARPRCRCCARESDRHDTGARSVFTEVRDVRGNLVHDAHTAILMREHGIREIYTRDTDFHRFSFLRVVDPLA
jgi:predicted nucleic acid-binding protein